MERKNRNVLKKSLKDLLGKRLRLLLMGEGSRVIGVVAIMLLLLGLGASPLLGQKVVLRVSSHMSAVSPPGQAWEIWKQWIEKESGGKIKIQLYHGGTLLKADQQFRGVQGGIADIAIYVIDRADGFHLNRVIQLPFLPFKDIEQAERIYAQLLKEFPQMRDEWSKRNVVSLGYYWFCPNHLHTRGRVVRAPADVKGMRIFSAEDVIVRSFKYTGATMVELDIGDLYTSLEKGLVEGFVNQFATLGAFGVTDLLPTHILFGEKGIFVFGFNIIMNKKSYENLDSDTKNILEKSMAVYIENAKKLTRAQDESIRNYCKQRNHVFVTLSQNEIEQWAKIVEPFYNEWMREGEKTVAERIFKRTLELCQSL